MVRLCREVIWPVLRRRRSAGPHPAGLAGTHIHFLEPLAGDKTVWTVSYQDVIVIGRLMLTGTYDASCVVALAGPVCKDPRLVRTVAGASLADLAQNDLPQDLPVRHDLWLGTVGSRRSRRKWLPWPLCASDHC